VVSSNSRTAPTVADNGRAAAINPGSDRRPPAHLQAPALRLDLIAEELRLTQNALGEITGEFGADDLLGAIFSRFCIGK
jgi:tRNA U34 5-carboxymethylaminomethyl modifying GTPase MnmE/TrmE